MFLCAYFYVCVGINSNWFSILFFGTTRVTYNTFSCLFLCTFSVDLRFDINFVWKQVRSI
ncbi:hypothetical protein Hanom_Chr09g00792901 [Helianthus anomalus]